MRYEGALAAYAALGQQAGDASGKFDAGRWNAAMTLATQGSGTAREVGLGGELPPKFSDNPPAIDATLDRGTQQDYMAAAKELAGTGATPEKIQQIVEQLQRFDSGEDADSDESQALARSIESAYKLPPGTLSIPKSESAALEGKSIKTFGSILPGNRVHETMGVQAANKVFGPLTRWEADALATGVAWPDAPCAIKDYIGLCPVSAINSVKILPKVAEEAPEFGSLSAVGRIALEYAKSTIAYQSHLGKLQFWHSMAPEGVWTNGQVLEKILNQSRLWYDEAQDKMKNGHRLQGFFNFGKLLHMVQDAFAGAHVARDEQGQILFFQGYEKQSSSDHAKGDDIPKYGKWSDIGGAKQAYAATIQLTEMFKRGADTDDIISYLRASVYAFAPDAQSQTAGGTLDKYARKP